MPRGGEPANNALGYPGAEGQCATCQHWQQRGGAIMPATVGCRAFEDELPPRTAALVTCIALDWARAGACPACELLVNEPDSYLAMDLPMALVPAVVISTLPHDPPLQHPVNVPDLSTVRASAERAALAHLASMLQQAEPPHRSPATPPRTPVQQHVLAVLCEIRADGERLLPALEKRSRCGLTSHERNEVVGVYAEGGHIGNRATGIRRHIRHAGVRSLRALVASGHAVCEDGVFIAKESSQLEGAQPPKPARMP